LPTNIYYLGKFFQVSPVGISCNCEEAGEGDDVNRFKSKTTLTPCFRPSSCAANSGLSGRFSDAAGWLHHVDCKSSRMFIKGHDNEADFLGLQKLVPHRSLTLSLEPFQFWLRIRGDIRNRKMTP